MKKFVLNVVKRLMEIIDANTVQLNAEVYTI